MKPLMDIGSYRGIIEGVARDLDDLGPKNLKPYEAKEILNTILEADIEPWPHIEARVRHKSREDGRQMVILSLECLKMFNNIECKVELAVLGKEAYSEEFSAEQLAMELRRALKAHKALSED